VSNDQEPVGSLGEEAVKLLGVLQDWAKESGGDAAATSAASAFKTFNEHIATGDQECKYCPLCQVISAVREVSPEVKQHLTTAASSLLQAAAAAMATDVPRRRDESAVEKIDLSDEAWDD
jgi:hypothetical protein